MNSLIFLAKPCPSLPIIWKFCWVVGWPVLLLWYEDVTLGFNFIGSGMDTQPTTSGVKTKGHIIIPYTEGLCKSIKRIYGRYDIQTHFKGNSNIKNLLVSPKDKDPMANKSGAIYWLQCGDLTCNDEYIGESPGPLVKDSRSTWRILPLYIIIAATQVTPPPNKTSK